MELRALTFDGYGTLVDQDAGVRTYVARVLAKSGASDGAEVPGIDAWMARWERVHGQLLRPWRPYREVLVRAFEATMRQFGLETFVDDGPGLARSLGDWPVRGDATRALRRLARRYQLAIVVNGDRDQLGETVGRLLAPFSSLVTAEDVHAYKPDPRVFALVLERLGLAAPTVMHVAAREDTDLGPARALGMRTARVGGSGDGPADLAVPTLAALADALGA